MSISPAADVVAEIGPPVAREPTCPQPGPDRPSGPGGRGTVHPPRPGTLGAALASSATRARPRCDSRDRHHVATWHRAHPKLLVDSPIVARRTAAVWAFGGWRWDLRPWGCLASIHTVPLWTRLHLSPLHPPGASFRSTSSAALDVGEGGLGRGRRRSCRGVGPFRRRGIGSGGVVARSRAGPAADGARRRAGARHRRAAAGAGAGRLVVDFDPACRLAQDVVAASGLDWRCGPPGRCGRRAVARRVCSPAPPRNASVVRTHPPGVTVMPSAEGTSLRSDPAGRLARPAGRTGSSAALSLYIRSPLPAGAGVRAPQAP